jgi:hypothetical protein
MGERRGAYRVLVGKPEERDHLEFSGVDGRIILKWISKDSVGSARTGLIWLRIEEVVGCCLRANEPLCSIKVGNYLKSIGTISVSNWGSAPWR